jgi:hypothetical protein
MDNNNICEYSGLPSTQSYVTNPQTQAEGAGVGGESIKENFIDSSPNSLEDSQTSLDSNKSEQQSKSDEQKQTDKLDKIYEKLDIDFMYNWIRKHSGK